MIVNKSTSSYMRALTCKIVTSIPFLRTQLLLTSLICFTLLSLTTLHAQDTSPTYNLRQPIRMKISLQNYTHTKVAGTTYQCNSQGFFLKQEDNEQAALIRWHLVPVKLTKAILDNAIPDNAQFDDYIRIHNIYTQLPGCTSFAKTTLHDAQQNFPEQYDQWIAQQTKANIDLSSQTNQWPKVSPQQRALNIDITKKQSAEVLDLINKYDTVLYETDFFLLYSDLPKQEVMRWERKLDDMYRYIARLFNLQRNENIWLGKCPIFIFKNKENYNAFFNVVLEGKNAIPNSAGQCVHFSNGDILIAFYKQKDVKLLAHILYHETVHGILYRYRSSVIVPSFWNEGFAEAISTQLSSPKKYMQHYVLLAQNYLQKNGIKQTIFEAPHIAPEQYPVALTLTKFMMGRNRSDYAKFIDGIKDGQHWIQSLKTNYHMTPEQLFKAYSKNLTKKAIKVYRQN